MASKKPTYNELEQRIRELEQYQSKFNQAERDYLAQKQLFEIVVNELPFWFSLKDKHGKYLLVNKKLAQAHGAPVSAFINRPTLETPELHPGGLKKMMEKDDQVLSTGERLDVPEYPVSSSMGERWRRLVKIPWKNEKGEILGVISWSEDITEQKKAKEELLEYRDHLEALVNQRTRVLEQEIADRKRIEKALRESEEKYRRLFEHATDAIFITQDGFIKFPNPSALDFLGYTEAELRRIPFADLIHPEDRPMVVDRYKRQMADEKDVPSACSLRAINKHGEIVFVNANVVRIAWEGRPAGLNFVRDITQQRRLEARLRQAQKMESLGTLAGGIAHEFNNILGIIIGNTELAQDDLPQWNPVTRYLQQVKDASLRAKNVVRQILTFAQITPGIRKPTPIRDVVEQALKLLKATLPKEHTIQQEILCAGEMINSDPADIHQVLMNLCSNSVHAMEGRAGILTVRLENLTLDAISATRYDGLKAGRFVKLSVADNGMGMDEKVSERIFDPYFTTKDVGKGFGLGLAVVYGIAKKYGGTVRVTSEFGKGTCVEVLFPMLGPQPEKDRGKADSAQAKAERILFIDDEPALVKMTTVMLERQGYRVVGKTSSPQALELFRSAPDDFDLIITDMAMPELPGDVLVPKITAIRPDIPIIFCTGYSDRIDEKRAQRMGIAAFVLKPLAKKEFLKTVGQVLEAGKKGR